MVGRMTGGCGDRAEPQPCRPTALVDLHGQATSLSLCLLPWWALQSFPSLHGGRCCLGVLRSASWDHEVSPRIVGGFGVLLLSGDRMGIWCTVLTIGPGQLQSAAMGWGPSVAW